LLTFFLFSICVAEETWQEHWIKGRECFFNSLYQESAIELDVAINLMTEEEQYNLPFVFVDRIENDYMLGNYVRILEDTEKALSSKNLTDYERLT
jgi:hypothetical protein